MFEVKDIVQIIAIPLITVFLAHLLDQKKSKNKTRAENDRKLFLDLRNVFEIDGDLIYLFRDHSVGDLIHRDYMKHAHKLETLIGGPGFIFSNRKMENLRKDMHSKLCEYLNTTSKNLFVKKTQPNYYELRYREKVQEYDDPEIMNKFTTLAKDIDDLASEIYLAYRRIAEIAQKQL